MEIDLEKIPNYCKREDSTLYSESQGRLIVTINPECQERFEEIMVENKFALVGKVRGDNRFFIRKGCVSVVNTTVGELEQSYKSTFGGY